jgi:hypothetical protein
MALLTANSLFSGGRGNGSAYLPFSNFLVSSLVPFTFLVHVLVSLRLAHAGPVFDVV